MANISAFYREFEKLCALVLRDQGYGIEEATSAWPESWKRSVDFVMEKEGSRLRFVDVKWAPLPNISLDRLRNWATQAAALPKSLKLPTLLISSGIIDEARRFWAEREFNIEIWDRERLLRESSGTQHRPALEDFFRRTDKVGGDKSSPPVLEFLAEFDEERPDRTPQGLELIKRLEAIKPGKEQAKDYELICEEIISYLFGDHLLDPRAQLSTEDDLNFYDIIYRLDRTKSHPFWEALTRDFRARVILFECKNYSAPIAPIQVYTTERYLSVGALRSVCFLLSRQAPHEHAELAAFGAMRESGKLLIFLSDDDIKSMLRVRDAQLHEKADSTDWISNDPTVLLDQKIYNFIARLPR